MKMTMRENLLEMAEEDFRQFQSKLMPGTKNVLGVRLPKLRQLAREIARGDWRTYLATAQDELFEEVMLQGMVIGCARADINEMFGHWTAFVPKINNWAVCDSFCSSLKITNQHMQEVWHFLQSYLQSSQEFELRFGLVMLLTYYINEEYLDRVLELIDNVKHDGYYVKMAAAWAISICFIKFPEKTMLYLRQNKLDKITYNKALQKITESNRVDKDVKAVIRGMKRQ